MSQFFKMKLFLILFLAFTIAVQGSAQNQEDPKKTSTVFVTSTSVAASPTSTPAGNNSLPGTTLVDSIGPIVAASIVVFLIIVILIAAFFFTRRKKQIIKNNINIRNPNDPNV
ncbi:uncharacterized protein OCT59_021932 [Rhizophagus irregularis]|uniref:Uncharacterized protein n=1 Tax=Rhizophagus irregularis (strain DAOM 197198w) TaxID=1432141 RepID=A0A015I0L3_RHIIW|nr:hypothetical protein RirG_270490 [Rhizophagus irregularis DAOM 197198w]UZO28408.1 hypothetical protein OCT59_021932 [Rhizophagus irregularis]